MSTRRPLLVNSRGVPVSSVTLHQAGDVTARREQPTAFYQADKDTAELLSNASWKMLLSAGRFLFANSDVIRGALLEQASYSFPLHVRYMGADSTWGEKVAEPWLYEWKKQSNLRGGVYDQQTNARLRMLGYKVDGDVATVLTFDEDEYPRLQYIRAHRIGNREWGNVVMDGPYKGRRIVNGVILDDYNRTLAYLVLGNSKDEDQYVSAAGMFLTYRPDYFDQARGISHLVASIRPFSAIKRLHEYELRAHAVQSSFAAVKKNETGEADEAASAISTDTAAEATDDSLKVENLEEGLILYLKQNAGDLELLRPDRPGTSSQEFWQTIIRGALYGLGWDADFALAIKEPGGAWARTIIQKINRAIAHNVAVEAAAQRREDWFAINQAIALKRIPGPRDGDTWSWEYQLGQPQITADSGNDLAAKREAYKLGLANLDKLMAEGGDWWKEHRAQREKELRDLLTRAQAIKKDFPELTLQECLNLLEQRTPNGAPPAAASDSNQADQADAPKMDTANMPFDPNAD